MKILLVDDELELVSTLAERLSFRGIDADWVTAAEEALRRVEEKKYDVIVLDVKIPGISGLELKKKLQKKRSGMKYIFITGHGSVEDFRAAVSEDDVTDYLPKPVNIDVLIARMRQFSESKETQ